MNVKKIDIYENQIKTVYAKLYRKLKKINNYSKLFP